MMALRIFPSSCDAEQKRDFLFYLAFFFALLPITVWGTSDFIMILMSGVGIYHIYFIQKSSVDKVFVIVLIFWLLVNILSWAILGGGLKITTLVGSCLKLFLAYAIMKIAKERFIVWYEHLVFLLTLVSIVFFTIQLIKPEIFYLIPFNFASAIRYADGHWNGLIFNYSTYHVLQNSGFEGEPGTFGYLIGLAMVFNLFLNQGKINFRFIFFAVVGLTTFSTNFYLSLLIFVIYFLLKLPFTLKLVMGLSLIPIVFAIYQLPFISEKLDDYLKKSDDFQNAMVVKSDRINRMAIFLNDINDVSYYPFGHGINETGLSKNVFGRVITGTNGISRLAVKFGLFGVIFFLIVYFKLVNRLSLRMKGNFLFTIIILMYITANPMERDFSAMALFWLYFLTDEGGVRRLIENYREQKLLRLDIIKRSKEPIYSYAVKNFENLKRLSGIS